MIRQSEEIRNIIVNRLGFFPDYLGGFDSSPAMLEGMWTFMSAAYLDSPLPKTFREKIICLKLRDNANRRALMFHCSELFYAGQSTQDIIELLDIPLVSLAEIEKKSGQLIYSGWPAIDSNEETFLVMCSLRLLQGLDRNRILQLLKAKLPANEYEQLVLFISFCTAYADWCESVQDENKNFEHKVHDRIANLIDREPGLEKYFSSQTEAIKSFAEDEQIQHFLWERNLQTLPFALAVFDYPDLKLIYENDWHARFFPLTVNEAIAEKIQLKGKAITQTNIEVTSKDLERKAFDVHYCPLYNDKHEILSVIRYASENIDDPTTSGAVVKEATEVLDDLPVIIFKANSHGKVYAVNQRWRDFTGSNDPEEWETSVHPADNARVTAIWRNSVFTGKPFEAEFRIKKKNGVYQWHLTKALPEKSDDGTIIQWIGTSTNIEDQKNHAQKIFSTNKMVEVERQKYESLFNESPAAMAILKGQTLIFEKVNGAFFKFLGDRDVIGKPLLEAIPEIQGQPFVDILHDVYESGVTFSAKESMLMLRVRDHQQISNAKFFDLTYQRMDNQDGTPYGVFIFAHDVSEKVMSRHSLQESEKEFRMLAEVMPQIIFTANPNGEITYFNERWEQYTGYSFEQTKSWSWSPVHHPDDLDRVITVWNESLTTGKPFQIEYRLKGKDGLFRWFLGRAVPIKDAEGSIFKWIGTNTDIHDQKIMAQKLESALDQVQYSQRLAENANEAKSAFLANMSHEIRTPLGAIMGFVGLMKNPNIKKEDLQKYISITQRNSEQLLKIIDDILDLSKVEAGKLAIEKININFAELINDFASTMELRASENGIAFKIEAKSPLPCFVFSDPTRVKQILMNIVGNAIKFTQQGSVELSIRFEDSQLEFTVKDTGVGIDAAQARQLFQPFSQADASTTRKYGGTGLGLILTQRLCEAMGGKFYLKHSEVGVGSTFVATVKVGLPAGTKFFESFNVISDNENGKAIDKSALSGIKVLVIDDLEDNLTLLNVILSEAGASVVTEIDAFEGIRLALERKFDVILMDIQMPLMNGYEVMKKIKKAGSEIPIVALTAHAMKDERERALQNGFSDFLAKPLYPEMLISTIKRLYEQKTYVPPPTEKILIVEDDHDLRDLLEVILTSKGLDVTLMETGEALLNYMATHDPPKLILVDLALPFMSGNELIPILNKRTDRHQYRVIIASGWDDLPSRAKILNADGYLKKPYNPQTIADSIKKFIPTETTSLSR